MPDEIAVMPEIEPWQGESWDSMVSHADQVQGSDLAKGDLLIGIPHMAVQVTIRRGDYKHKECGKQHPVMFIKNVIGPEADLDRAVTRGRINAKQRSAVDPGEVIGFNEAGTGYYRQILAYLESHDYLNLPEGPVDGPFGESRFDSHPETWEFRKGTARADKNGEPIYTADIRLYLPRGLRASDYENEYTQSGHTRYAG